MQINNYANPAERGPVKKNTSGTEETRQDRDKRKICRVALQGVLSTPTYIYNVLVTETQTREQTDDW
jgi:hypothetical protein